MRPVGDADSRGPPRKAWDHFVRHGQPRRFGLRPLSLASAAPAPNVDAVPFSLCAASSASTIAPTAAALCSASRSLLGSAQIAAAGAAGGGAGETAGTAATAAATPSRCARFSAISSCTVFCGSRPRAARHSLRRSASDFWRSLVAAERECFPPPPPSPPPPPPLPLAPACDWRTNRSSRSRSGSQSISSSSDSE